MACTTAIFDDRVIAVAPAVIDLLNITPSFLHHWRALGEWSPAIADYSRENIMEWLGTPEFDRLMELTDPYSYLDEFDKPRSEEHTSELQSRDHLLCRLLI